MTSHGGPIIPNVQVEDIFYGSAWTNPADPNYAQLSVLSTDIQRYLGTITGSSYLDGLSQYDMMNGSGQCVDPGRGQLAGTDFVSDNIPGSVVYADTIRGLLPREVDGGRLPAPNGNTLYMIFLPPNVYLQKDSSPNNQDAYHGSFRDSAGRTYYFAPIANPTGNYVTKNAPWTQGLTPFQAMTEITSHELVEAISNPDGQGWYDSSTPSNKEIADIAGDQLPGLAQASRLDGYVVQKYWSEATKTNIAPGGVDFHPMQQLPDLSNIQFQFAGNSLTLNYLTSTGPTNASFSGTWGSSTPVRGWVWVDGTNDEVHIRVERNSDSVELFDGTITAPDGNWGITNPNNQTGDYLEISGTVYPNSTAMPVYEVGYWAYSTNVTGYTGGGTTSVSDTSGNPNTSYQSHRNPVLQ